MSEILIPQSGDAPLRSSPVAGAMRKYGFCEEQLHEIFLDWKFHWFETADQVGLNSHSSGYFSWWLNLQTDRFTRCDSLEEARELNDSFDVLAEAELDVVQQLSDVAIELRWTRLAQNKRAGDVGVF